MLQPLCVSLLLRTMCGSQPPNPTPLFQHSPLIAQLDSLSKKKDRLDAHVLFARGLILYKNSLLVQYPFLDAFLDFLGMMRTGYNQFS